MQLLWVLLGTCATRTLGDSGAAALAEGLGYESLVQVQTKISAQGATSEKSASLVLGDSTHEDRLQSLAADSAASKGTKEEDSLTVLMLNTYMLEARWLGITIREAANLPERSQGIAKWINTLKESEVPDVLVFNEIFSDSGEAIMREICTDSFKVSRELWEKIISPGPVVMPCDGNSKFAFTTGVGNPTGVLNPIVSSGVVILVKKGLKIESADDQQFWWVAPYEFVARKGFFATKVVKDGKAYWVVGTHTSAYQKYRWLRAKQFKAIRDYLNMYAKPGDRVVIAGDMNTYTKAQKLPGGGEITQEEVETDDFLKALGDTNAPATGGDLVERGFWLPLNEPLDITWDEVNNHLSTETSFDELKPTREADGNQMFDWVIAPGPGDRFQGPSSMKRQVVPFLGDVAWQSSDKKGALTDDLSDHYGIYAKLCYADSCAPALAIAGHTGSTGQVPSIADILPTSESGRAYA